MRHQTVLQNEVVDFLACKKGGVYVDATLGGGGHTRGILERLNGEAQIIGIDQDKAAIQEAQKELSSMSDKMIFINDNFSNLEKILADLRIDKIDGIILDLGISSMQLSDLQRGFSFQETAQNMESPLDMRMDQNQKITAAHILNYSPLPALQEIFSSLGQERYAGKIGRTIVARRRIKPFQTVGDLLGALISALPPKYRYGKSHHFATNVFRALRMAVNQELEAVQAIIPVAIEHLGRGGRIAVISFHSLEDRLIKQSFNNLSRGESPCLKVLTRKPIVPSDEEIRLNPRARSAKLRVAEKI